MNYIQIAKTYCCNVMALFIGVLLVSCGGSGGTGGGTANPTPTTFTPYTPALTGTGALNDTGITASQCYGTVSPALVLCNSQDATALNNAQDGMVGRDVTVADPRDGKLGFSFSTVTGGCVKDNVTGLTWEVKTIDGGVHDWGKTYTNNAAGEFVTAVNSSTLCGHSDWRLPTADELQRIVDYSVASPGPTIDATWFTHTQSGVFWSGSPYFGDSTQTWGVNFSNGLVGGYLRSEAHYVRLVRADQ